MKRRIYLATGLAATLLLLSGCMGYRLGGSRPEGVERITLNPIVNKSGEPAIEQQLDHALRARLQFDGRLKLVDAESADAAIDVTLTGYHLTAIAFRGDQRTTAKEYRIRLDASATLTNRKTGETISEAKNYGEAIFAFTSDLTSAKRSAARQVSDDLAKYLVDDLIEQWKK